MLQGAGPNLDRARGLRQAMSLPEVVLWQTLRERPSGLKFRRQHPSGPYVADFYCHAARLIIEIDGMAHDFGDRPQRDAVRDQWFAERGIATLRISAQAVLDDVDSVLTHIVECAAARLDAQE